MCGIVGIVAHAPVNQSIYDALLLLQHRGQDAAGIVTAHEDMFYMHKGSGLVRDVFRTRNMRSLPGNIGIGQVRYPTSGSTNEEEAQPFYVNAPFGIVLAHNGNITNTKPLRKEMFKKEHRHTNTNSDTEVLLNVLAHEIQEAMVAQPGNIQPDTLFQAVSALHRRVRGSYATIAIIAGVGLLAFRDPFGIRPLCIGTQQTPQGLSYMLASESAALEAIGFTLQRDVGPGEAIFIDQYHHCHQYKYTPEARLCPCIFEYVYLARPDSTLDGACVYTTRLMMGKHLAHKIAKTYPNGEIDVVIPIPDTSGPAALELALTLNLAYREGFVKNRYIGRTFLMPGQAVRQKSVRQKLHAIRAEFRGKSVCLVDDSIVRGTTSREIIQIARDAGAKRVIFASAAPPVIFPNVYGIDMPTRNELIAYGKTEEEICQEITADGLVYQDLDGLLRAISTVNPALTQFEASCFNGHYVTGDISQAYLDKLNAQERYLANHVSPIDSGDFANTF